MWVRTPGRPVGPREACTPLRAGRTHAALCSAARGCRAHGELAPSPDAWSAQHNQLLPSLARPEVAVPAPCCLLFSRTFLLVRLWSFSNEVGSPSWPIAAGPSGPACGWSYRFGLAQACGRLVRAGEKPALWRQPCPFSPSGRAPAPPSPSGPEDQRCAGAPLSPHLRPCESPFLADSPACIPKSDAKPCTAKRPASRHLGAGSASASRAAV